MDIFNVVIGNMKTFKDTIRMYLLSDHNGGKLHETIVIITEYNYLDSQSYVFYVCIYTIDDKRHRSQTFIEDKTKGKEDGPALLVSNGSMTWYCNNRCHRKGYPAVISPDIEAWYIHDKQHRRNGPAVESSDGVRREWYINGDQYTEEAWKQEISKFY